MGCKEMNNIKDFVKDRDEAIKSLDATKILDFNRKYNIPLPDSQLDFWGGVHKARLQIHDLSDEERQKSVDWLVENGFRLAISHE